MSISYLCFAIISLSYYIVLQNLDSFNKKYGFYGAVFIGILMIGLGVLMICWHPLPSKSIIFTFLGFAFIGGGTSLIFIPALFILALSITNVDFNLDDQVSNQITSSLHLFISNFGDFCGPIIGGMISSYLGFKFCCLVISLIGLFYCAFFFVYFNKKIIEDWKTKNDLILDKKTKIN